MQHRIGGAVQQITKPSNVGQPRARVGPRRLQQQMVGFIFAQHIIDEVSGKGHLLARLALARMLPLDKAADHRDLAKGALQ